MRASPWTTTRRAPLGGGLAIIALGLATTCGDALLGPTPVVPRSAFIGGSYYVSVGRQTTPEATRATARARVVGRAVPPPTRPSPRVVVAVSSRPAPCSQKPQLGSLVVMRSSTSSSGEETEQAPEDIDEDREPKPGEELDMDEFCFDDDFNDEQEAFCEEMKADDATVESILDLFDAEGDAFTAGTVALAAYRVSEIAWSDGLTDVGSDPRVKRLLSACWCAARRMRPDAISGTAQAVARMKADDKPLMFALGDTMAARLAIAKPYDVVSTAVAFGELKVKAPSFYTAVADHISDFGLDEYEPNELVALAWSYGQVRYRSELLADIADDLLPKLQDLEPIDGVTLAWAFVKAGFPAPGLFAGIADVFGSRWNELTDAQVDTLTVAFASAKIDCPPKLMAEFRKRIPQEELARILNVPLRK